MISTSAVIPHYNCTIEVEVTEGLEAVASQEVKELLTSDVEFLTPSRSLGALRFVTPYISDLFNLKVAESIYIVEQYQIPRPKSLLGHQHFTQLLAQIALSRGFTPEPVKTFYISAAGSDSAVMQRLKREIAAETGLEPGNTGDLQIRILPSNQLDGWEVHVRLGARPLSARKWRVCWFKGALNATVAHAMIRLAEIIPGDIVVNLCSGSATLLIEMCLSSPSQTAIGIEMNPDRINCARENVKASSLTQAPIFVCADAGRIPLPNGCAGVLLADLPFGQQGNQHQENIEIYPEILSEAARIARRQAHFVLITHEIRLIENYLRDSQLWLLRQSIPVNLRGLHPRIYVLERL